MKKFEKKKNVGKNARTEDIFLPRILVVLVVVVVRVFVSVCAPYCAFKRTLLAVLGGPIKWPLSRPEKKETPIWLRSVSRPYYHVLCNSFPFLHSKSCEHTLFSPPSSIRSHGRTWPINRSRCEIRFFLLHPIFFFKSSSFRPLTTRGKSYGVGLVIRAYCEWGGEANQETPPPQVGGGSFCGFVAVSVACLLATKVLDGDLGIIFCTSSERHKIERKKKISARRAWGSGSMHGCTLRV